MGYYMRFFDTGKKRLALCNIRAALRRVDRQYTLEVPDTANPQSGTLRYAGVVHAEIDISKLGDRLFESEIAEMLEAVDAVKGKGAAKTIVREALGEARRIIVVCVRFGTKEVEDALSRIDPLWDWLFAERPGLLHAEGEGFYDGDGLILAMK